ncbi:hypothetical protein PI124_g18256 [Phytophthora idaei]|nr:hypothetical protein PI125_g19393 [Phytophthora idaei]KAG3136007.1 hypothetical protein PI126_g18006 [Phytophthora idaei]KAG3236739.1 hypothetical protein PI124_g18256 [Phytophthora idaei]
MERRPAYLSLTLVEKHVLCEKYTFEPSLSHSELAGWATHHFHTARALKRTTVQSILKWSAEFTALPDSQCGRNRRCSPALSTSDAKIMGNITESKAWHDNAAIKGSIVLKLAQHEGVELPSGTTLSRGWLYRFKQRMGLWFSLRHGEGNSVDEELMKEEMKALQAVVAGYHPLDVYNMDETAFYYRREPRG